MLILGRTLAPSDAFLGPEAYPTAGISHPGMLDGGLQEHGETDSVDKIPYEKQDVKIESYNGR